MSETTQASETPITNAEQGTPDEAVNAFMSKWESAEKPEENEDKGDAKPADNVREAEEAKDQKEEKVEEQDLQNKDDSEYEYVTVEVDEDGNETIVEEATPEASIADDNMITKVKVGEEEFEASVQDLKRLYGQEKALTKKSQIIANQRKANEAKALEYEASLQRLMEKAKERYKPYEEVDMLVAAKTMSDEDFMQLRREATMAKEDMEFFEQEAGKYAQQVREDQQKRLQAQAVESVKQLKEEIPEWSPDLYNKMRSYAVSQGIAKDIVDNIVEPGAIKMMIKAMRYDDNKSIATKKRVVRKTKRVLKSGVSSPATQKQRQNDALEKLKKSGDTDDAVDAFLSRWQK